MAAIHRTFQLSLPLAVAVAARIWEPTCACEAAVASALLLLLRLAARVRGS